MGMTEQATKAFLAGLPDDLQTQATAMADLGQRLRDLATRGATAWPTLTLPAGYFLAALGEKAAASPPKKGLVQWLDHVQPADLHLALACGSGLPGALQLFEERYAADLDRLIRKYAGTEMPAEDLLQQLREKLFVTTDTRRAKIDSYSGQGYLQNWLRVTGARAFIDILRSATRRQDKALMAGGSDGILEVPDALQDVELDFLKREYRSTFREAFAAATRTLSPHQRNLLRQHLVHHLTVEQLGQLHGVHGATISRRMAKARQELVAATRQEFMGRVQVGDTEYESIMGIIRSKLDLSIPRLLETTIAGGDDS